MTDYLSGLSSNRGGVAEDVARQITDFSDVVRYLAFAGIACVWAFRQVGPFGPELTIQLAIAAFFVVCALALWLDHLAWPRPVSFKIAAGLTTEHRKDATATIKEVQGRKQISLPAEMEFTSAAVGRKRRVRTLYVDELWSKPPPKAHLYLLDGEGLRSLVAVPRPPQGR